MTIYLHPYTIYNTSSTSIYRKPSTRFYNLLLLKLKNYGISCSLLSWFRSYLTDRLERVVLDDVYSNGFYSHQISPKGTPNVIGSHCSALVSSLRELCSKPATSASKVQLLFLLMIPNCINLLISLAQKNSKHVKDLGVIVSSDMTWSKHIEVIVAKANN